MANKIDGAIELLARALKSAANIHGRPNTFTPGDIADNYRGPPPMIQGKIGRDFDLRCKLHDALGGYAGWGTGPSYGTGSDGLVKWAI